MKLMRPITITFFFLIIFIYSAASAQNVVVVHGSTYGSDDKWWKCAPIPMKGCDSGPLDQLELSVEEMAFVQEKLDSIPWYPKPASPENIAKILGNNGGWRILNKQDFRGVGPGGSKERGVSIYYSGQYVSMIRYFQPGRFLLTKRAKDKYFEK